MPEERRERARERMLTIAQENEDARSQQPVKDGLRLLQAFN